jgi:hypothetical protein
MLGRSEDGKMNRISNSLLAGALFLGMSAMTVSAQAGVEACGNIDVEAGAECTVEAEGVVRLGANLLPSRPPARASFELVATECATRTSR